MEKSLFANSWIQKPQGMHFTLNNEVLITGNKNFDLFIIFNLTDNVFVDFYELTRNWNRKCRDIEGKSLEIFTNTSVVDPELFIRPSNEFHSTLFAIKFHNLSSQHFNFSIPLHTRYHSASFTSTIGPSSHSIIRHLSPPQLYIRQSSQNKQTSLMKSTRKCCRWNSDPIIYQAALSPFIFTFSQCPAFETNSSIHLSERIESDVDWNWTHLPYLPNQSSLSYRIPIPSSSFFSFSFLSLIERRKEIINKNQIQTKKKVEKEEDEEKKIAKEEERKKTIEKEAGFNFEWEIYVHIITFLVTLFTSCSVIYTSFTLTRSLSSSISATAAASSSSVSPSPLSSSSISSSSSSSSSSHHPELN